jgi:hypothetical protein
MWTPAQTARLIPQMRRPSETMAANEPAAEEAAEAPVEDSVDRPKCRLLASRWNPYGPHSLSTTLPKRAGSRHGMIVA